MRDAIGKPLTAPLLDAVAAAAARVYSRFGLAQPIVQAVPSRQSPGTIQVNIFESQIAGAAPPPLMAAALPAAEIDPAVARIVLASTAFPNRNLPTPAEPRPGPAEPSIRSPDLELLIPAQPRASDRRSIDDFKFVVRNITVEGNRVYPAAELRPYYADLIGREATLPDIVAAAEAIEERYRADGFILSRAFVPAQNVADAVFKIQVVEGYLAAVEFDGGSPETQERIRSYMQRAYVGRPANMTEIERGLLLAGDLAGVRAGGTLTPATAPGASNLLIQIQENPVEALVTVSNRGSKFQGPVSTYGEVSFNGLLGNSEQFTVGLATVPTPRDYRELEQAIVRFNQPVGDDGLVAGFDASYTNSWPGHTLRAFKINTESLKAGPRVSYPAIRSRSLNAVFDASAYVAGVRTKVQDDYLTRETYSAADFRATVSQVGFLDGATVAMAGVTRGIGGLGTTAQGNPLLSRSNADPKFNKFYGELRRLQLLPEDFSLQTNLAAQYSRQGLFASEEFALGGVRFGRGYDPSEITGRNGWGMSAELRYGEVGANGWQPYGFYDTGQAWNNRTGGLSATQSLASGGAGVRFAPTSWSLLTLEVAQPLTRAPSQAEGRNATRYNFDMSARF